MPNLSRRSLLMLSAASLSLGALPAFAQPIDELVIADNVNLPSWDPTVGLSAVNPTIQGRGCSSRCSTCSSTRTRT